MDKNIIGWNSQNSQNQFKVKQFGIAWNTYLITFGLYKIPKIEKMDFINSNIAY